MYGYAANSAAATAKVTPFTAAPQTTNPAGLAAQSAQAAGTSAGTGAQSSLSQLISTIPTRYRASRRRYIRRRRRHRDFRDS